MACPDEIAYRFGIIDSRQLVVRPNELVIIRGCVGALTPTRQRLGTSAAFMQLPVHTVSVLEALAARSGCDKYLHQIPAQFEG